MWPHHLLHFPRSVGMNNLTALHSIYCILKMTSNALNIMLPSTNTAAVDVKLGGVPFLLTTLQGHGGNGHAGICFAQFCQTPPENVLSAAERG
jgi:hypothetical protein